MAKKLRFKCTHDDCFTCPYPDCIADGVDANYDPYAADAINAARRERDRKYAREYYWAHREEVLQKQRKKRAENAAAINAERRKKYKERNYERERRREYAREYYEKNREKFAERYRKRYREDPAFAEHRRAYSKAYREKKKEERHEA